MPATAIPTGMRYSHKAAKVSHIPCGGDTKMHTINTHITSDTNPAIPMASSFPDVFLSCGLPSAAACAFGLALGAPPFKVAFGAGEDVRFP
eukprot:CAMPEP_0172849794 /NCGR_PEP_ID=MMETSP1075-20121228/46657_1 /TAXON_ID=2916 /ORGANISM="Ceratium fusus, Strain PA161109" /LENGTH=90 /DNA_ID=CAMNT_0013695437 /DNA_START=269 /DNA_END=538 /DNA_ORIENTATION=+